MTKWIRFNYKQDISLFGTLAGDSVDEYGGDLFETPKPTGRNIPLNDVQLQAPLEPYSIFALSSNSTITTEGCIEGSSPIYLRKLNFRSNIFNSKCSKAQVMQVTVHCFSKCLFARTITNHYKV